MAFWLEIYKIGLLMCFYIGIFVHLVHTNDVFAKCKAICRFDSPILNWLAWFYQNVIRSVCNERANNPYNVLRFRISYKRYISYYVNTKFYNM